MSSTPYPTTSEAASQQPTDTSAARTRLVVLGASNVARGIATVVQTARSTLEGPFDLMAALGHGRSYGRGSWVLGRWLPGIVDCHLWSDLAKRDEGLPATALVTDVGNDILYGASTDQIIGWVETCLQRLQQADCRIAMTGIPLGSLQKMGRWEFPLFRTILYPGCRLTFDDALAASEQLAQSLQSLAGDYNVQFVDPDITWYGHDRIHIARRSQSPAWQAFIQVLGEAASGDRFRDAADESPGSHDTSGSWREFFNIRRLTPHHRKLFGFPQGRQQPAGRLKDGTRVSLY